MNTVKVEITSRETIKPSSPTPHSLQNFKLSLLDQLSHPVYVPFIFFYAPAKNSKLNPTDRIAQIKTSLSEILTRFYPVSERLKDNSLIDCNNEGVDFLEAQVSCSLQEIRRQPEPNVLNNFLPQGYVNGTKSPTEFQLAAQVNTISCGGITIDVCFLHKIFDGSMIGSFINGWAATARGSGESVTPIFSGASLFPPRVLPGLFPSNSSVAPITKGQGQIEVHDLVREMRSEITKFDSSYVRKMQADFGWGKPVWMSSAAMDFKNATVLMDTATGEAWVTLDEQDMPVFESNQEILKYASYC
ncbi:HXXXD-type acyl-transferase family protein [Actinidia rufa]|uniref:HXXXD-type acyl-transferase family protein n=1 Tax=Actinidia rufa TaxID=165716 RepID=A0A7J0FYR1_9ERIC|nr:HXXXD-type acyl-transferase family protein [Actinidia rufa]